MKNSIPEAYDFRGFIQNTFLVDSNLTMQESGQIILFIIDLMKNELVYKRVDIDFASTDIILSGVVI